MDEYLRRRVIDLSLQESYAWNALRASGYVRMNGCSIEDGISWLHARARAAEDVLSKIAGIDADMQKAVEALCKEEV